MIKPSYKELIFIWIKIGAMSLRYTAQILVMFNCGERRKWLKRAFNSAPFCSAWTRSDTARHLSGVADTWCFRWIGYRALICFTRAFVVGILTVIYIYCGTNYYMKCLFRDSVSSRHHNHRRFSKTRLEVLTPMKTATTTMLYYILLSGSVCIGNIGLV